jgi:hypothetical protein
VLFGFSATPNKLTTPVLTSDAFIDLMIEKGCAFGWFFQYVPIGRKPDVKLMSTPEQRNALRETIARWRASKPIFLADFWNDGPYVRGCIAAARPGGYFHINCRGDVEPCVFLQFSTDNIKQKSLVEAINSPFFKALRQAQPYNKECNLLAPCALIDNPEVLRQVVKRYGAKPSYNGSNDVIEDKKITKWLDSYSAAWKALTLPIMRNHFSNCKHWKEVLQK